MTGLKRGDASIATRAEAADPLRPAAPESFGRRGSFEVRLAATPQEVDAAQALRYRVFYEEMSAVPSPEMRARHRDFDRFDDFCDHLLVIDHGRAADCPEGRLPPRTVVGCYRLLRQEVADAHGGFYTAHEFDIAPLFARVGAQTRFLELGRSCVLAPYRNKPTVELLWHGIGHYLAKYRIDVMFGCASFESMDPAALALPLSYLHHFHRAPAEWSVRALSDRYVEMNRIAREDIDLRAALRALPPMIKGYIRAGCYIGDGAVIDEQFGTTDVLIIFPVSRINERYRTRFAPPLER